MTQLAELMYDAIHAENIPTTARIVAGYVNGRWPSVYGYTENGVRSPSLAERCPDAVVLTIAVSADADADILDIERFDATPDEAPAWYVRQKARGNPNATVYCNTSTYDVVRKAFMDARVAMPAWWAANYTVGPHLWPHSAATQYGGPANLYDLSVLDSEWPLLRERMMAVTADFTSLDRSKLDQIFGVIDKIPEIFLQNQQTQSLIGGVSKQVSALAAGEGGSVPAGTLTVTLTGTATPAVPIHLTGS